MRARLATAPAIGAAVLLAACGSGGSGNTTTVSPHASSQAVTNAIGGVVLDHFTDPSTVHCRVGPTRASCVTQGDRCAPHPHCAYDAKIEPDGTIVVNKLGGL